VENSLHTAEQRCRILFMPEDSVHNRRMAYLTTSAILDMMGRWHTEVL
jgi:hypothetical protein